jgi:hypothetical protein
MIPISHFSKSHLFDTNTWSSIWDLTLTLKQARKTDDGLRWVHNDEDQCRGAFRHFMNLLNRAVYGNAFRRHDKQLRVLPILENGSFFEKGTDGYQRLRRRWHFHAAIEPPRHVEVDRFKAMIEDCWSKVDWGYRKVLVRPNANRGWISYMLKYRQKSAFEVWSDCIDWESLHNTSNC